MYFNAMHRPHGLICHKTKKLEQYNLESLQETNFSVSYYYHKYLYVRTIFIDVSV